MQSESEKVPSVRVWRRNRPSRRNHKESESNKKQGVTRRVQKQREVTSSLFESHLSLFLQCAQHNHLVCYCRADAVKDKRSEVNHFASNACALYAEESKGEALSEADLSLRSSQSRLVLYCHWQCLRSLCRGVQGRGVKRGRAESCA